MSVTPTSQPFRITATRLWRVLLLVTVLGGALPVMPWLARQGNADFSTWRNLREARPELGRFVDEHPALDPMQLVPAFQALPWSEPAQPASMRFYWRYAMTNAVTLILLVVFRKRVRAWLDGAVDWLHTSGDERARKIVFAWGTTICVCFLTRIPLGFWIPAGIGGWTYAGRSTQLEEPAPSYPPPPAELAAALRSSIATDNAAYLPGPGTLVGPAMLLHYRNGDVWPGNYELVDLPKHPYLFGAPFDEVRRPEVFLAVVRNALAYRRRGARFLLPTMLAYPNHRAYQVIDYRNSPPAEELVGVSFWSVSIRIDESREVEVIGAEKTNEVKSDGR